MTMKRRSFLKKGSSMMALAGSASVGLPIIPWLSKTAAAQDASTPLPIPELLENLDKSGETATFAMDVRQGSVSFFRGKQTSTLGYNDNFLGPTIRVRDGQNFRLRLKNNLSETTTLHWHGLHVPANWDGGPRQPITAGTEWNPEFTIKQEAATLWYHPHAMGLTGSQVYKGLAGLFLIDDEVSDRLDIPKTYGVDDIPLVIQDRRFFNNGQFAYVQSMHDIINGVVGNYLLVNGALKPTLKVKKSLVRLRILNGSNSSIYKVSFSDSRSFQVIASDGGFLERPVKMNSILLSAGERAEILVDFADSKLRSEINLHVDQLQGRRFNAMKILASELNDGKQTIPAALRQFDRIDESSSSHTRRFVMETMGGGGMGMMGRRGGGMMGSRLTINGKRMNINRIDERIKAGTTEIWEISNRSGMMMSMPHSMHLHDVQFQILSRNGQPPQPHELGRKDTVLILPGEAVRIIIKFGDYKGVYMYHCHLLEHEDDGMMGQFEIV